MGEENAAFGLPVFTLEALRSVLTEQGRFDRADVYGSRAMGSFRPGSDIEISLRGEGLTMTDLFAIERETDDLDLPYKVDLSIYSLIEDPALLAHIDRVGCVLYEAKRARQSS